MEIEDNCLVEIVPPLSIQLIIGQHQLQLCDGWICIAKFGYSNDMFINRLGIFKGKLQAMVIRGALM